MSPAVSALLYLWFWSLLNRCIAQIKRLRQPKYLIGAVLGLGYLYMILVLPRRSRQQRTGAVVEDMPDLSFLITTGFALGMLLAFSLFWLWRRQRNALQFTEAEIAFLFPAPIAHRTLMHFNLIRTQLSLALSALIFAVISANWQALDAPFASRFLGWWLLMGVFVLHLAASGSTLTRLYDRGLSQTVSQLLVAAVLVVIAAVLVAATVEHFNPPALHELDSPAKAQDWLQSQLGSGPLYWLLLPLRALAKPFVASDSAALLQALPAALLVYALHYAWALYANVPNAEGAITLAQKRASRVAALKSGSFRFGTGSIKSRAPPFRLRPRGRPEVAFLWKNLLSARPYLRLRSALLIAAILIAIDLGAAANSDLRFASRILTLIAGLLVFYTFIFGPHLARQDLRSDMANADVLKTWPLEGWQIVLGSLLAPAAILTGILWLSLLQLMLSTPPPGALWLMSPMWTLLGLSMAMLLPLLCAIELLVLNATAVLFPAWTRTGGNPGAQGIDVMGQRILFFAAQWMVVLIALVPALLIALVAWFPLQWLIGLPAILPAAIVAAVVLAGELAWGINWLGARFDAYDVSE